MACGKAISWLASAATSSSCCSRAAAQALRDRLQPPYALPDGPIHLDASIGIACFPADGADADSLLTHADRAMYANKKGLSPAV